MELGFEPKTHSLEGCCSIQLSYSTKIGEVMLLSKPLISPNINFLRVGLSSINSLVCLVN